MAYAAYAEDEDQLDLVIDNAAEDAGGDVRAAVLDLVRRQHRSETVAELRTPASRNRRRRRYA